MVGEKTRKFLLECIENKENADKILKEAAVRADSEDVEAFKKDLGGHV